jgi:ribonuclease E
MTKRLLIDASHAEETRVVVLDGNRLEDFDVETQSRRQLKGNIYLAKVVRVEPSLQAAFVEYGGNRHGFLAFGEIHPDYYQIPVADRQRLIELQEEEARAAEAEDDAEEDGAPVSHDPQPALDDAQPDEPQHGGGEAHPQTSEDAPEARVAEGPESAPADLAGIGADIAPEAAEPAASDEMHPQAALGEPFEAPGVDASAASGETSGSAGEETGTDEMKLPDGTRVQMVPVQSGPPPETVGGEPDGDAAEEARPPRPSSRFMRSYKIQEVIRRRQILLVQVVKEERGTKGAALTTYISLAGRYCVLMPNSPRGGGISRKITSAADRRRLKEVTAELDLPRGMGLIVRTAGAARPKAEIKRDGEYLLRLWDDIREQTLQSTAPALIYEEASLIKRAIRDVYSRDVDELIVDGEDGWRAARDYMRMLMPAHVKKVQLWPQGGPPLFSHAQVEMMLDSMLSPTVQLRSGGYLVINQTEALVAIDVNSGRSTRERGIEETALRTNLEAAEEAARQLRLRDLAGLIVIDFIDMESKKHNAMVERRMADALKNDRARIQIGHISHFGLLELSRQRLRPSLAETSLNICPHCGGLGHVRSTESAALHVLREIEEEGGKRRAAEILVSVAGATALFILNNKRQRLTEIEQRYGMRVSFVADESLLPAQTRIDRIRAAVPQDLPPLVTSVPVAEDDTAEADLAEDDEDVDLAAGPAAMAAQEAEDDAAEAEPVPGETAEETERRRKRRRRRRRGGRREDAVQADAAAPLLDGGEQPDIPDQAFPTLPPLVAPVPGHDLAGEAVDGAAWAEAAEPAVTAPDAPGAEDAGAGEAADQVRARRGRRGGRRRRKGEDVAASEGEAPKLAPPPVPAPYPAYVGPTPADPFALGPLDIFDVIERSEMPPAARARRPEEPAFMPPPAVVEHPTQAAVPEPAAPDPAVMVEPAPAEPEAGPVIKPVLIGSGDAVVVERKRGWWRR